ncbi:hypothetical protein ACQPZX_41520 [Actinoplanes sp. CA-142083]|uniref:hypothetical protein n=1 Tax=Actinoplanes sp. CA-142083 TaxID=3239903 RepID=UPI003D8F1ACD
MTADLKRDERVFLYPKTKTAPTICYLQPQATVLAKPDLASHVQVLVDGEDAPRRIHADNVVRTLPNHDSAKAQTPRRRPALPDGMQEAQLW